MYTTVFDISDRFPAAALTVPFAFATAIAIVLALFRRPRFTATAWVWLAAASVGWSFESIALIAGVYGLATAALGLVGFAVSMFAARNRALPLNDTERVDIRPIVSVGSIPALVLVTLVAFRQWPAFGLADDLTHGRATFEAGVVENAQNNTWARESFSINGRVYSYVNYPDNVGFHQTAANGGPVRNGVHVRIWSIGDTIVRLDIGR